MFILLVSWIAIGLITGFVGSKLVKLGDDDPRIASLVGAVAAVVGGGIFHYFAKTAPNATDYWSIVVAAAVGVMAVIVWFAIRMSATRA